jgi:3-hydroxybutyryl-CoA dehydrogenase
MTMTIEAIGVVGAGTMGHGIAQVCAQAGFSVCLVDAEASALARGRAAIEKSLAKFVDKGVIAAEARDEALARVHTSVSIDDLAHVDCVIEAIAEQRDAKRALFGRLDAITRPGVILASNTSSLSITDLATATRRPAAVCGIHFMNPVPLMTLVELVRGQATSDETMAAAQAICARLGKTGVEASDYPGFLANRILMPMINEAVFALMEGVGTAEAIDTVMTLGMNHPMGPLTLADFIGLDVCLSIMEVLHRELGDDKYRPCPLLRKMVAAGRLGRKSGQGFYTYG